jgi:hypothetical protein
LSAADFSTTLNVDAINGTTTTFDTGIIIDCGLFTDPIIYEGNLTLAYVLSSIQFRDMDGGPIIRTETGDIARDTGKNLFVSNVLLGNETQLLQQDQETTSTAGTVYIRDIATGATQHISAAYADVLTKYNTSVQNELISSVQSFNVYNDVVYFRTTNYFVADKIGYDDGIQSLSITNNYINIPASAVADVSEPFFFEDKGYALTCMLSVASAQHNDCCIVPIFYKLNGNASLKTIAISGLTLSDKINTLDIKIKKAHKPLIVYNSRNDLYALLCTLYDCNNVPYIYQMFFDYDTLQIIPRGVRIIDLAGDVYKHTINWYDDASVSNIEINDITATPASITVDTQQGALIING